MNKNEIPDIVDFVKEKKLYKLQCTFKPDWFTISVRPFLSPKILYDLVFVCFFIYVLYKFPNHKSNYYFFGLFLTIVSLWLDLNAANKTTFDFCKKEVTVTSNNYLRRLFIGKETFQFAEITSFETTRKRYIYSSNASQIFIVSKQNRKKLILDLKNEDSAQKLSYKLLRLIKITK